MNENNLKNQFLIKIYKNYKDSMFSIAFNILKDEQEAENIVQESIISLDKKYDKLRKMDDKLLSRYVHKTVKNKSINSLKRLTKIFPVDFHKNEETIEVIDYDISFELLEQEFFDEVAAYLRSISEPYAEAFMYRYYNDYSDEHIADLMSITENYARVLIYRAKQHVKDFIS